MDEDPPPSTPLPNYDPSFASPDADIVLRSSDGHLFRVYSSTLRTTCGFFRDMLTLPQGDKSHSHGPATSSSEETIPMDEGGLVLKTFLRIISCLEFPRWTSCKDVMDIMKVAEKYDSPGVLSLVRLVINSQLFDKCPLEKYAIACRFNWTEEAKAASTSSLALSIFDHSRQEVLKSIPSSDLLNLLTLHVRRKDRFRQAISSTGGSDLFSSMNTTSPSSCKHINNEKALWHTLHCKMLLEFEKRPLGDTLFKSTTLDGPEGTACWQFQCPSCRHIPFKREIVVGGISTHLKQMPFCV